MPLYEYECSSCGDRFERIQRFSDPPEKVCPACGGPVQKLLSSPAIRFKGSGWYVTDYAKKSDAPSQSGGPEKSGSSSGAQKDEPKGKKETKSSPGTSAGASGGSSNSPSKAASTSSSSSSSGSSGPTSK